MAVERRVRIGPRAGRDQDVLGGDDAAGSLEPDAVVAERARRASRSARRRPWPDWRGRPPSSRAISLSLLAISVGQSNSVGADAPAVGGAVLELLAKLRGVDEELLRHAAADDAGAADPVGLGDGDARSRRRRLPRRADAARAGADDEKIVVVAPSALLRGRGLLRGRPGDVALQRLLLGGHGARGAPPGPSRFSSSPTDLPHSCAAAVCTARSCGSVVGEFLAGVGAVEVDQLLHLLVGEAGCPDAREVAGRAPGGGSPSARRSCRRRR